MTYTTKNATIVFAFAALLLAMPLAQVAVAETTEASMSAACGFQPANIVMTAITRDALQAESAEATFTITGDENTANGKFIVTPSTNWFGDGDRASTTIQMVNPTGRVLSSSTVTAAGEIADGTVLTIGGTDLFTGGAGTTGANQFDITPAGAGLDVTDLVRSINALATTTGKVTAVKTNDNTITLTAKTGTLKAAGDAITVVSGDASLVATEATLGAGTAGIDGTSVTVNSKVYIAAVGAKLSNLEFSMDGDNKVDATNLAVSIAAEDNALRTTTANSDTVTVKAFVRGTGGNSFSITTTDDAKLNIPDGTSVFTGGGANVKDHLLAQQTKFQVTDDGTTSSQGTAYGDKVAFNAKDVATEMEDATQEKNLRITLQTSTEATATPTGTVTLATVSLGDTVTVNGLVYTAVAGAHAGDLTKFTHDDTDINDATDLANSINLDTRIGLFGDVNAASGGTAVVTITHKSDGIFGNQANLLSNDAGRLLTSGALLGAGSGTLGAEPLFNLPYDGALKMTVTYSVECT